MLINDRKKKKKNVFLVKTRVMITSMRARLCRNLKIFRLCALVRCKRGSFCALGVSVWSPLEIFNSKFISIIQSASGVCGTGKFIFDICIIILPIGLWIYYNARDTNAIYQRFPNCGSRLIFEIFCWFFFSTVEYQNNFRPVIYYCISYLNTFT